MIFFMNKKPTNQQRKQWEKIAELGCVVHVDFHGRCNSPAQIHHIDTGGGGRKNHDRVIPLCENHHTGLMGLHKIGRKRWQNMFGTEQELFDKTQELLS